MTVRRVCVSTRGPAIAEKLRLDPTFGIPSAACHLRDALQRMQRFSRSQGKYVALEGTSQIAVDEVVRALELLDVLGKQSEGGSDAK